MNFNPLFFDKILAGDTDIKWSALKNSSSQPYLFSNIIKICEDGIDLDNSQAADSIIKENELFSDLYDLLNTLIKDYKLNIDVIRESEDIVKSDSASEQGETIKSDIQQENIGEVVIPINNYQVLIEKIIALAQTQNSTENNFLRNLFNDFDYKELDNKPIEQESVVVTFTSDKDEIVLKFSLPDAKTNNTSQVNNNLLYSSQGYFRLNSNVDYTPLDIHTEENESIITNNSHVKVEVFQVNHKTIDNQVGVIQNRVAENNPQYTADINEDNLTNHSISTNTDQKAQKNNITNTSSDNHKVKIDQLNNDNELVSKINVKNYSNNYEEAQNNVNWAETKLSKSKHTVDNSDFIKSKPEQQNLNNSHNTLVDESTIDGVKINLKSKDYQETKIDTNIHKSESLSNSTPKEKIAENYVPLEKRYNQANEINIESTEKNALETGNGKVNFRTFIDNNYLSKTILNHISNVNDISTKQTKNNIEIIAESNTISKESLPHNLIEQPNTQAIRNEMLDFVNEIEPKQKNVKDNSIISSEKIESKQVFGNLMPKEDDELKVEVLDFSKNNVSVSKQNTIPTSSSNNENNNPNKNVNINNKKENLSAKGKNTDSDFNEEVIKNIEVKDYVKHNLSENNQISEVKNNNINIVKNNINTGMKDLQNTIKTIKTTEIISEITRHFQNTDIKSIVFQLSPENLGKIKLLIDYSTNRLTANIEVENEQVKQIIQSNLEQLKNNLQNSGIQLSNINVNIGNNDQRYIRNGQAKKKGYQNSNTVKIEKQNVEGSKKMMGYNTYEYLA